MRVDRFVVIGSLLAAAFVAAASITACSVTGGTAGKGEAASKAQAGGTAGSDEETEAPAAQEVRLGWEIVKTECVNCHPIDQIDEARKDWAGWRSAIDHMIDNGLELDTEQTDAVVAYLTTRQQVALRGAELVQTKCTTCHLLDRIESARKDWSGWSTAVQHMMDGGAPISSEERELVVEYLAIRGPE